TGANKTQHALRRTNADKRRAVEVALELRPGLSDPAIADHCGVSAEMVRQRRAALPTVGSHPESRTGRAGRKINTSKIGKKKSDANPPPPPPPPEPTSASAQPRLRILPQEPTTPEPEPKRKTGSAPAPVAVDAWGIPVQPHAAEAFAAV